MDTRMGFSFIPDSIKIFLTVSDGEAAKRIFKEGREKEKENIDFDATYENIKRRRESEKKRYMEYYKVDYEEPDNYDLVIDTTDMTIEEVVNQIIEFIKTRGG